MGFKPLDHIYKNEIYIFVPELKKSNMVIIKTKTHLEKDMWVVIKITNDNNVNKKIEGELIEVLPDDVDSIVEKKYKLNQILVEEKDKKKENDMDNPNNEQQRFKHVYLDQKNLNTFTIDPFTSKDCDDAFSIDIIDNKIHIYVHISDVSYYINPDYHLFEEIVNRGNTYYGSVKNWSMIPREYSDNYCSILPNKETRVVTTEFIYNQEEQSLEYVGWYYSIIESKKKLWYDYVDEKYEDIEVGKDFRIIYESSQVIKKSMNDYIINKETKSHEMVRYWMIYVNQIMCKEVKKIYRCNPPPSHIKFNLLQEYIKFHTNIDSTIDCNDRNSIIKFTRDYNNDKLLEHKHNNFLAAVYVEKGKWFKKSMRKISD